MQHCIVLSKQNCFCSDTIEHDERLGRKYIVYEHPLLELFQKCRRCDSYTNTRIIGDNGFMICVVQDCPQAKCGYHFKWWNQSKCLDVPELNVLFAGAAYCVGLSPAKLIRLMDLLNICCTTERSFYRYASDFVQPVIFHIHSIKAICSIR